MPAGESVSLQITAAFLHATENLPKLIGQSDRASRVYSGNVHFLSPYTTIREKTTIKWDGAWKWGSWAVD